MSAILRFIKFYWRSETKHNIKSSFVVSLIENVFEDNRTYYDFSALRRLRNILEQDNTKLKINDLGAGSKTIKNKERSIKSIVKSAVSPQWQCEFLFRLVHYLQPKNRLELGTSLGLSSLHQYIPLREAPFYTLEGCPSLAKTAKFNFKKLKAKNIELCVGDFSKTLPAVLEKIERLDYVFIDGNHQKSPTLSYFEQCLYYSHSDTIFVFDDIHWSADMESAWNDIKQHPKVKLTIDLFYMGLVFLSYDKEEKDHINIIPTKYKPWKMKFKKLSPLS
ncbi:MAG: class I SAM-dependent methyltransferase [Saprospiraceae bacterium]|nr:class I SAM-dependent methyltransferase [Saprospiraceae bacterium]